MRISTLSTKALTLLAAALYCFAAQAADNKFYYFYEEFHTMPTGAGKVYVSKDKLDEPETITEWDEYQEATYVGSQISSADFYCYTQPAAGWIPYGVVEGVRESEEDDWRPETNEDGSLKIKNDESLLRYTASSTYSADDEATCIANAPLLPEHCCFVVFSHVVPRMAAGMSQLGSVSSSKSINDIGDEVQLTATPKEGTTAFLYWKRKSDGQKLTDNPLTVTVEKAEEYVAYFKGENTTFFDCPDGEYILWYNPDYASLYYGENEYNARTFKEAEYANTEDGIGYFTNATGSSGSASLIPGIPHILWLKGEALVIPQPLLNPFYTDVQSCMKYTEEALPVSELPVGYAYYNVNMQQQCFTLMPETQTVIPANSYYLQLDEAYMWNAPVKDPVIYWDEEAALKNEYKGEDDADGLTKVEIENAVSGVYSIGGIPLKAIPNRGIYIIDGKKIRK